MIDLIEVGLVCVVVLAGCTVGIFGAADLYGRYQCSNYADMTGKRTKWVTIDSCYIEAESGWQRWDEYTRRAIASEGLKQ